METAHIPRVEACHVKNHDSGLVNNGRSDTFELPEEEIRLQSANDDFSNDDIIGISISRVQTHLRSPTTPATEKARAMDMPVDYFQQVPTLHEDSDAESESDEVENDETPGTPYEEVRPPASQEIQSTKPAAVRGVSTTPIKTELQSSESKEVQEPDLAIETRADPEAGSRSSVNLGEVYQEPRSHAAASHSPLRPSSPSSVDAGIYPSRALQNDLANINGGSDDVVNSRTARSSITKSLLGRSGSLRRRSFSASSTSLLVSLKKILPDSPLSQSSKGNSLLNAPGAKAFGQRSLNSGQSTPIHGRQSPVSQKPTQELESNAAMVREDKAESSHDQTRPAEHQVDGNVEPLLSPVSPKTKPVHRQRSNSEGSLYLRRKFTDAATYDDIHAFSHVSEMVNSRFKAITDSFRDSNIKFPSLATIRPILKRRISPEALDGKLSNTSSVRDAHQSERLIVADRIESESTQQRAHPILARALSKASGDLVILGGYRGSILRSAKPPHRQLWVPIKVGLNLRKVDLEVGLTREDEESMEDTIIPGEVLSHIGPIDICRRLLRHLHKCPNTRDRKLRIHNWGYDWRLSPDLTSGRLIKFLEGLPSNQPGVPPEERGALVVAHSLGGLVTRHAVNQRPELFAGVVFAGTPQHCVNILGPLRKGDDVLLSSRVLTAQVNFSVRTSYALLPESGRCFIQKDTNERMDVDFFDPKSWHEYRLSPCVNPPLPPTSTDQADRRKSIIATLADGVHAANRRSGSFENNGSAQRPVSSGQPSTSNGVSKETARGLVAQDLEGSAGGAVGPAMMQNNQRPSVATTVTISRKEAQKYLERVLAEVLTFKQNLNFIQSHQDNNLYPPHSLIFGKTVPTVFGAKVASRDAIKHSDAFDDLAFAAGDGVVLASAAQLPDGYRCVNNGRVESDRGHVGLLGDLEGVGKCIEAVIDARRKGVGLGKEHIRREE
jgi:pimeloyl-ACP methyl ester carboxylesterase